MKLEAKNPAEMTVEEYEVWKRSPQYEHWVFIPVTDPNLKFNPHTGHPIQPQQMPQGKPANPGRVVVPGRPALIIGLLLCLLGFFAPTIGDIGLKTMLLGLLVAIWGLHSILFSIWRQI